MIVTIHADIDLEFKAEQNFAQMKGNVRGSGNKQPNKIRYFIFLQFHQDSPW